MKKVLTISMTLALIVTLCACGKSAAVKAVEEKINSIGTVNSEKTDIIQSALDAYSVLSDEEKANVENYGVLQDASKKIEEITATDIFGILNNIYDIVDEFGTDIQDVWASSISNSSDIKKDPISYISHRVGLDSFSFEKGVMLAFAEAYNNEDYHETYASWSDDDFKEALSDSNTKFWSGIFSLVNPLADFCVNAIRDTYYLDGSMATIEDNMKIAKDLLKKMEDYYPDSETYTILKGFYTEIDTYYDFCINTTGNFAQASSTINDLRSSVKSCQSQLDFIL